MSDIADRYRQLSGDFAGKVAKVSPAGWGAPSPCEDWTARDVVARLVHQPGVCGPSVDVEPDADDQTKLLAPLGRHV